MEKRSMIYLVTIFTFILIAILIHTILILNGHTTFLYERVRDFFDSAIAFAIILIYIKLSKKNKNWTYHLIIINLAMMVFVIHMLRLVFGGLPC